MKTTYTGMTAKLSLILALIMSMTMSACSNTTAESGQAETTVQSETAAKEELKQVSVSEFVDNIYIEGVHIPFPCTFGELCHSYDFAEIKESEISGNKDEDTGLNRYSYRLYFKSNSEIGFLRVSVYSDTKDTINDTEISSLYYCLDEEHFDICGLNENSKFDDMVAVLGNDYVVNAVANYEYTENNLRIEMDFEPQDDRKIRHIKFSIINKASHGRDAFSPPCTLYYSPIEICGGI